MSWVRVPGNDAPEGAEEHWLEGRGGVRIRCLTAPAVAHEARGSIILCPGRTEFIEKYFEVIGELQRRAFAVFAIDWRGQGLSGRMLANHEKGHFESFDDPVNDLASALKILASRLPRPHVVLAHSMGGGIALRAMQTRRIEVDAAAFTAPMWGIAGMGPNTKRFARFMASVGAGKLYAPGVETKWKREINVKRSSVTQDRERHARSNGLVVENPELALAGPTIGWIAGACEALDGFLQPGALQHLRIPMLVLTAGKEQLVDNKQVALVTQALPQAKLVNVPGAKHEILMEQDEYRAQFWQAFDAFAAQVAPASA